MQHDKWIEFFADAVQSQGLTISQNQCGLFLRYMLELLDWNRTINITRIVEPRAVAIKHFLDSLLVTLHIQTSQKIIADVGSGGGFPGIPLAILDPGCTLVLIESVRKKAAFLNHIIRTLRLGNVQVYNGRAQSYPAPGSFDLAISRAFASLSEFVAIAMDLIKPPGSIVCMKGQLPLDEIKALQAAKTPGFTIDIHRYCLPEQGDARSLVIVRPCFT